MIADIAGALAERGINIETISAEAIGEKGAITLTADDHDGALRALTDAGFKTVSDESLVLRLQDEPGALARLAERFKQAGVNIRSLHFLDRRNGYATVAISADDRGQGGGAGGAGDGRVAGRARDESRVAVKAPGSAPATPGSPLIHPFSNAGPSQPQMRANAVELAPDALQPPLAEAHAALGPERPHAEAAVPAAACRFARKAGAPSSSGKT